MGVILPLLLLLPVLAGIAAGVIASDELFARDGFGRPVAWWAVLKLPMHVRDNTSNGGVRSTPCDCAPPACANAPTKTLDVRARATGLCYLYADARDPTFRHFRALGLGCLGQGGNDPLTHTLRQLQQQQDVEDKPPYWALFNDQLDGIARSATNHSNRSAVCAGGGAFSAHAKGAVGFRADSGGFFLQTSTPGFPDPTPSSDGAFVRLGCQVDNNVQFAQHAFAMSLDMAQLDTLGAHLQAARLCSRNFYSTADEALGALLASDNLARDGANATTFRALYDALLNPQLPPREQSTALTLKLKKPAIERSAVFVEANGESLPALDSRLHREAALRKTGDKQEEHDDDEEVVHVLVKSPRAAVPPWALLAESLESDVSVASWWDSGFGIPNVCAGDDYSGAPHAFCLADDAHGMHVVNANGTARFNIENLVEATWKMHGENASEELTWHLVGGRIPDGNHAKWGLTSPRDGAQDPRRAFVTFADLNMEGFPCSRACNGSQGGRGGAFFSLQIPSLHESLATSLVSRACRCSPSGKPPSVHQEEEQQQQSPPSSTSSSIDTFVDARMCRYGCWRKLASRFVPAQLPRLSPNATSFWPA